MNDKEDCAWVFDSLVGFLQGPIWSAPLLTFIEEKSLSMCYRMCYNNYIIKKKKRGKNSFYLFMYHHGMYQCAKLRNNNSLL